MKIFPIWCDVNFFFCFYVLINAVKTDTKLTLHDMGKILLFNINIKFKIWRVTVFKKYLPLTNLGCTSDFRTRDDLPCAH